MLNKKEFIIIFSIILVTLGVFGLLYIVSEHTDFTAESLFTTEPFKFTQTGVEIPRKIHSYNGIVEKVSNQYILLKVESVSNYVEKDSLIKIYIDKDTNIVRYTLQKAIPEDARFAVAAKEEIGLEDIKINDKVQVWSKKNIANQTEYTANVVRLVEM